MANTSKHFFNIAVSVAVTGAAFITLPSASAADPTQIRAAIVAFAQGSNCLVTERDLIAALGKNSITSNQAFPIVQQMMKEGVARRGNGRLQLSTKICKAAKTTQAAQQTQQAQVEQTPQVQATQQVAPQPQALASVSTGDAQTGPFGAENDQAFGEVVALLDAVRLRGCEMTESQGTLFLQQYGMSPDRLAEISEFWVSYGDAWIADDGSLQLSDHLCGVHDVEIGDFSTRADRLFAVVESADCQLIGGEAYDRLRDAGFLPGEIGPLIELMINEGSLQAFGAMDDPNGALVARGGDCG